MNELAKLCDLPTPALVLDRARLERNTRFMSSRARDAGVDLRPHLKTAKSAEVAALATAGHSGGITVSTLTEAAYFVERGFTDITYAVCMVPARLEAAARLQARGARLTLLTDDVQTARALCDRAAALGAEFGVLIEIDSGEHRTGVAEEGPELLEIAQCLTDGSHVELAGVLTHGGHAYGCDSIAAIKQVAEDERRAVVDAAGRLRQAGYACSVVSAGSTPTAVHGESFDGLSEIRPGVYTFFDLAQVGLRSCEPGDIAISVLATVISHQPAHDRIVIDAGGLALSKDTSAGALVPDAGYGWVCDHRSAERIGDLRVALADQEHGYVEGSEIPYDALPIGSVVRVLPNHACMTAAAYDRYAVIDSREKPDPVDAPDAEPVVIARTPAEPVVISRTPAEPVVISWWDRVNGWGR